jgi:putative transposase
MTRYRRHCVEGGTYFFTVVTAHRHPVFRNPQRIHMLRDIFARVCTKWPVHIEAIVVLPDHLHAIWTLPEGDADYSARWRLIKQEFSRRVPSARPLNASRRDRREKAVWQRRFWEHTIRDDEDLRRHMDYIHYNPVKHGYVNRPSDWPWSSFHREVARGRYRADWGSTEEPVGILSMDLE